MQNEHTSRKNSEPGAALVQDQKTVAEQVTRTRPGARFAGMFAPAAGITLGLFLVMGALINTEYDPVEIAETREISIITPQEKSDDVRIPDRIRPKRLEVAHQPPPPPKYFLSKSDVILPTPIIQGSAPTELKFERVQTLEVQPVILADTDAKPIRPPVVTYPNRALSQGIEGNCQVKFNVDVRGRPYDLTADCTHSYFRAEALRSVGKVEFAPKVVKGKAQERHNVIYPLDFKLNG